jgi:hypothetical protein
MLTVTVVNQTAIGTLIVWGGANPLAQAATLTYPASGFISTNTVATYGGRTGTGPGGAVQDLGVYVNASASTGVAVDVVGYFFPPQATQLECQTWESAGTVVSNGNNYFITAPACPTGFTRTAPTFRNSSTFLDGLVINNFYDSSASPNLSCQGNSCGNIACGGSNFSGTPVTLYCGQICCRVPGR